MRIVLDTNVLISALVSAQSAPAHILARCYAGELDLLLSPEGLAELRRVLTYPRIRKRLHYRDDQLEGFVAFLEQTATVLTPSVQVRVVSDDEDDDHFIALALAGQALYLITGDDHLLRIGHYRGVTILKPAAFWRVWQTLKRD